MGVAQPVDHFYHVYAGGNWQEPVQEHLQALKESGLADILDHFYVGYVGSDEQIKEAEKLIASEIDAVTINKSKTGWEQETMGKITQYLGDNPVLYAHTKGSSDPSAINIAWRRSMTKECVIKWERAMGALSQHDAVGCHWVQSADLKWFFGGTFWWATPDYLRTLPVIRNENRWQAEHWIGLNPSVKVFDLKPGHPGNIPYDTDWRKMKKLKNVYKKYSYPGGWGDKGTAHNYIPTYEKYIDRTDGVTLLEIGVMRGHSIKMWNEYLTNSRVIGIDISLDNLEFELDNVFVCDGTNAQAVKYGFPGVTFDYVIDDGSHFVKDQLASLDVFLPLMNKGGVYFIEDIAGDEPLELIKQKLEGLNYTVVDGRGPDRPMDEIMVIVHC